MWILKRIKCPALPFSDEKKKSKEAVDNGNEFGVLLSDFSKPFHCIDHSLLLAKLYGYGISHTSLKLRF